MNDPYKRAYSKVQLLLFHFIDENNVHFIHSPQLDLTGYGSDQEEAKKSFSIVFEDFVGYALARKTLGTELTSLGWELEGSAKKPKKILAPGITSLFKDNNYVSEIFDKYPVNTYHEEIRLPAFM